MNIKYLLGTRFYTFMHLVSLNSLTTYKIAMDSITEEKTEIQRGELLCPSQQVAKLGLEGTQILWLLIQHVLIIILESSASAQSYTHVLLLPQNGLQKDQGNV